MTASLALSLMDGACLDAMNPAGCPDPPALQLAGCGFNRLVAHPEPAFFAYYGALKAARLRVAVVIARESVQGMLDAGQSLQDVGTFYAFSMNAAPPDFLVFGNEMDAGLLGVPSPASWSMEPAAYAAQFQAFAEGWRSVLRTTPFVLGGLVSGQPGWPGELGPTLAEFSAIDVHAYGKDAAAARDLFRAYHEAYGLGILALEWNREAREIPDYLAMLREETIGSCYFPWSDGMATDDALGLVTANGEPKDAYTMLVTALSPGVVAKG